MPWQNRLKEAAYTSPKGRRFTFDYEDIRGGMERNATRFEFPGKRGSYVQDSGSSARRLPIRAIFWGPDYDLEAMAFETAMGEPGIGRLEHPLQGTIDVVPIGEVERRDGMQSGVQAVIEVIFWETSLTLYPKSQQDPVSDILQSLSTFNEGFADEFANILDFTNAEDQVEFENVFQSLLGIVEQDLETQLEDPENVGHLQNISDSIKDNLRAGSPKPQLLAKQTLDLIQLPAKVVGKETSTTLTESYQNLRETLIAPQISDSNEFHIRDLITTGTLFGSLLSAIKTQFDTRVAALEHAEYLLAEFGSLQAWRETHFAQFEQIDTGVAYQQLQESAALTGGHLIEISFALPRERRIVLDRNHTIIDLCAELYGEVDERLDFFIKSNRLSGSEILELKQGREIAYYI